MSDVDVDLAGSTESLSVRAYDGDASWTGYPVLSGRWYAGSDEAVAELVAETEIPAELLRTLGAIPSYYLHYFYCTDRVVRAQATGPRRAEEVLRIEQTLLDMYADPALDHKPALLEQRGGAYYSEAAAALVTSLLTGDGGHHYVDVRNDGTITGLPDEAVVEVPALVDRAGPRPLRTAPLAPELLGLVQAVTAYEVLTIEAARTGDRRVALRALLANPLVRQWDTAVPLLDAILDANRAHLPRFSGGDHALSAAAVDG